MSQRKLDGLLKGVLLIWVFLTLILITTLTSAQPENSPAKSGTQHSRHNAAFESVQFHVPNATRKA